MACLDTTFIIDLINGRVDMAYLEENFTNEEIFISSPTIIELIRGLNLKSNLKNVRPGEKEETKRIISLFSVLELGKEEAMLAGEIDAKLSNEGKMIDIEDILIAAICIENNETLITRNEKHFKRIKDLKIEIY